MNATATRLHAGDVIEMDIDEVTVSALVLLASHDFVILDLCDGNTPLVARTDELGPVRVFADVD